MSDQPADELDAQGAFDPDAEDFPADDFPNDDFPADDFPADDGVPDSDEEPTSGVGFELDEVDVKDLLRAAMKPPSARSSVIRRGVQSRIREQSRGRYFADGWSVTSAPKATFTVTALLMLLLTLLAWALLSPVGVEVFTG